MLRAGVRTVKVTPRRAVLLGLVVALAASGCFSRRYPSLMERHLEVLSSYATKLDVLAQDERTVPAQDWGEFTYPLRRARDFARLAEARYPDRASLRSFQQALDAYDALVAEPAILAGDDAAAVVGRQVAVFAEAAARTRADLARERSG
jgi:hypothetical protein